MRVVLSSAVVAGPELEVLNPIVEFVSVAVVDGFILLEASSEMLGHDVSVFQDVAALNSD
jgi:hypothetical protein